MLRSSPPCTPRTHILRAHARHHERAPSPRCIARTRRRRRVLVVNVDLSPPLTEETPSVSSETKLSLLSQKKSIPYPITTAHWPSGLVPSLGRARHGIEIQARHASAFLPIKRRTTPGPICRPPWEPPHLHTHASRAPAWRWPACKWPWATACAVPDPDLRELFADRSLVSVSSTPKPLPLKINHRLHPNFQI